MMIEARRYCTDKFLPRGDEYRPRASLSHCAEPHFEATLFRKVWTEIRRGALRVERQGDGEIQGFIGSNWSSRLSANSQLRMAIEVAEACSADD